MTYIYNSIVIAYTCCKKHNERMSKMFRDKIVFSTNISDLAVQYGTIYVQALAAFG